MSNLLTNFAFIDKACQQLIQPKKCSYNIHQLYRSIHQFSNLSIENIAIQDQTESPIMCFFIKNTPQKKQIVQCPLTCIIYSHGLSSYMMEGKILIPYLKNQFSLCLYDSRGHGKSEKNNITYGKQESQDLYNIIVDLKRRRLANQFVLWGRSMGSASTLLMLLKNYREQSIINSIKQIVLDSPFSTFQSVACDLLIQNMNIPKIIAEIIIATALSKLSQKFGIDMRQVDITNCKEVKVPAIFVYSEIDSVIKPYHTHQIYQNFGGNKEKIKLNIEHNENRPQEIITQIFKRLRSSITIQNIKQVSHTKRGIMLIKNNLYLQRSSKKQTERSIDCKSQRREVKLNSNKYFRPGFIGIINNQTRMSLSHVIKQNIQNQIPLKKLGSRKRLAVGKRLTNHYYL